MVKYPLALHTVFSQLVDDCMDASFDADFDERGSFIKKRVKREDYWYFQRWQDGKAVQTYVGPAKDPEITKRVEGFSTRIKVNFTQRRASVRALLAAGFPRPDHITGSTLEALWKAGFFRLRGVLVGTTAYQCYAGELGFKLADQQLRTNDADFAQHLAISREIGETMPPMEQVLMAVDTTFRGITSATGNKHTIAFKNKDNYRVEFLTPIRDIRGGSRGPVRMPALGGVSAVPLSYLDFLIREPTSSVVLHGAGIPVSIPSSERYAIHKLIVAANRSGPGRSKVAKDIAQAANLILATPHTLPLAECWAEAWGRGPKWKTALKAGRAMLPYDALSTLSAHIHAAFALSDETSLRPDLLGFDLPKDL